MTVAEIEQVLVLNKIRKTSVRVLVLNALSESKIALSPAELESSFGNQTDRITLYRTLKLYEEKGLIHRIYNSFGEAKYAACLDQCKEHAHSDRHLHFNCLKCKGTFCMNHIEIPLFTLPEGMMALHYNFSVEGICSTCREEN